MHIILRPIRSSGSTGGALEEAGRAEQPHIITEAAPNELKLDGSKRDESEPSASWWRRGCSSGVIFAKTTS